MQTVVIGHKNPDMDSICSAIAYAELKRLTGHPGVIAARAGNTNERIDFVLERFGVEPPVFLGDISPRVCDVMERDVVSVRADSSAYDAIHLIEERRLRGLPVVDEENRCLGMLSAFRISHYLFPAREDAESARLVVAPLASIIETFGGKVLVQGKEHSTNSKEFIFMVGALKLETFSRRLHGHDPRKVILFVGDREKIQLFAIGVGVHAIVATGEVEVSDEVRRAAAAEGVTVISSPHDTATTVLLARGAVKVERMLSSELMTFSPDTLLEEAREKVMPSRHFVFPILDEAGVLVGMLGKTDFLKPIPRQLILVDHNELSQAVHGADRVPIVEILDHHRIGGFSTDSPILFWNNPVGSTSTIVALCYRQAGVAIPRPIAGLLLAGMISDTLNLTSPTTTATDREIMAELAKIAGTEPGQLANEIFSVGSPLLTLSPDKIITADCKEYEHKDLRFSVSQIEELSFTHFPGKQDAVLAALEQHVRSGGFYFAALLVTDITRQNSLLLVSGAEEFLRQIDFPLQSPNIWELEDIVSRKKQLLPYLLRCIEQIR